MRYIVFVILFSLWTPTFSQNYPSHAYELIFRFDTAKVYPDVKKIKHTSYIDGKTIKHTSAKLFLNERGYYSGLVGPPYSPRYPSFLLKHLIHSNEKNSLVDYQKDSLDRYTLKTYHDPTITDDSTKYLLNYLADSQRPKSISEYRYLSSEDTTILVESIDLIYRHNEIVVKYPGQDSITLHYVYNQFGNLIKLFGEDICEGCNLVFPADDWRETLALGSIPIEFHYEYDENGRVTAMFETTGGKRELVFTRKYIER